MDGTHTYLKFETGCFEGAGTKLHFLLPGAHRTLCGRFPYNRNEDPRHRVREYDEERDCGPCVRTMVRLDNQYGGIP